MTSHSGFILFVVIILHIFCVVLFLHGFLWHSTNIRVFQEPVEVHEVELDFASSPGFARPVNQFSTTSRTNITEPASSPRVDKLVLFLIDALRSDFIFGKEAGLKFVRKELQNGFAKGFLAKAQTPTVTLPRLKALTTGSIPNFVDIILNFGTQSAMKDNFVDQMKRAGQRVVFYGDDTWLRMFPNAFVRSQGVTSFLVNDYTEVDRNVSGNLMKELQRDDWDVMILHFLGLDHIGHLSGRHSSLVAPKLREMNGLIQNVYQMLKENGGRNLMVVFGDHGMTDSGSHGGNTPAEIETPMIFLSPSFKKTASSLKADSEDTPISPPSMINQVDLASTISLLMATPIPSENTGVFILPVLLPFLTSSDLKNGFCSLARQLDKVLAASYKNINTEHINDLEIIKKKCCSKNSSNNFEETEKLEEILEFFRKISTILSNSSSEYGIFSMGLAIFLLFPCIFLCIFEFSKNFSICFDRSIALSLMILHAVFLTSSSFIEEEHQLWYMWTPSAYFILATKLDFSRKSDFGIFGKLSLLFFFHRILREWNRTGNKWVDLPDVGDWLREPNQYVVLGILIFFATFLQMQFKRHNLHIPALIFASLYQFFQYNIFAWISYLIAIVMFCCTFTGDRKSDLTDEERINRKWNRFCNIFIGVALVIVRPHNLPVLALIQCMEYLLSVLVKKQRLSIFQIAFLYFIHGWSTFFLFGNSNAISSIDVAAGFAGIPFYFAPLHGLLMFLHFYIGPIFYLLSFIRNFHAELTFKLKFQLVISVLFFRLICLLVAFGNATLQRHHLFVWTVFAPKVLYESVHSFFTCFVAFLALFH